MELAGGIIGSLALVISLCNFGWNVYIWRRGGARIEVVCTSFATMHPILGMDWFVAVQVTNTGRAATTVQTIGFKASPKGYVVTSEPAVGPERLPKRLEPGESMDWPVSPRELLEKCSTRGLRLQESQALRPHRSRASPGRVPQGRHGRSRDARAGGSAHSLSAGPRPLT